jgi:four helix bundle protein
MHPFRRLSVWEKSHALALLLYPATEGTMSRRYPSLAAQLRRAVSSIAANLAEGSGHPSQAQFNRYITMALGSAREAEYHLLLAKDLGVLDVKTYAGFEARLGEISGMLIGLRKRVMQRLAAAEPPSATRRTRTVKKV